MEFPGRNIAETPSEAGRQTGGNALALERHLRLQRWLAGLSGFSLCVLTALIGYRSSQGREYLDLLALSVLPTITLATAGAELVRSRRVRGGKQTPG